MTNVNCLHTVKAPLPTYKKSRKKTKKRNTGNSACLDEFKML